MKESDMVTISERPWPRVMRKPPRGRCRSVDRGRRRPAIELRNHRFGVPTLCGGAESGGHNIYFIPARLWGVHASVYVPASAVAGCHGQSCLSTRNVGPRGQLPLTHAADQRSRRPAVTD